MFKTLLRRKYTALEFSKLPLPVHQKWELVNGKLRLNAAPQRSHQRVLVEFSLRLGNWLRKHPVAVQISDWDVKFGLYEVRRPDIVVALKEGSTLRLHKHGDGTPDLIIEIISPGHARWDLIEKRAFYEKYGVREYWVANPEKRCIHLFQPNATGRYAETKIESGTVKSSLLKGFSVKLNELFKVIDEYDAK